MNFGSNWNDKAVENVYFDKANTGPYEVKVRFVSQGKVEKSQRQKEQSFTVRIVEGAEEKNGEGCCHRRKNCCGNNFPI